MTPIPEPTRRLVYKYVITAAANVARDRDPANHAEVYPYYWPPSHETGLSQAIGRIAQGNGVGRADVRAIAREGAAAGW
jgi:hypothetical protein